jgi:hypothetical protein
MEGEKEGGRERARGPAQRGDGLRIPTRRTDRHELYTQRRTQAHAREVSRLCYAWAPYARKRTPCMHARTLERTRARDVCMHTTSKLVAYSSLVVDPWLPLNCAHRHWPVRVSVQTRAGYDLKRIV